jgi:hypothetical protein
LILTGLQSDDQGFGQTGVLLAALLDRPHATIIMAIEAGEGKLKLKRELEAGWFQHIECPLPAVLSIQSGINKVRYATLKGIMAAKKKELATVAADSLGAKTELTQKVEKIYVPVKTKKTEFLTGAPKEVASQAGGKTEIRSAGDLSMKILVVTEQRQGKWNNTSFETLAAAQQIASALSGSVSAAVVGKSLDPLAAELARKKVAEFCKSSTICWKTTRPMASVSL